MQTETPVIASGNLATQMRTITGVLGHFVQMEVPEPRAREILLNAGLPPTALETPDFPISLQQELEVVLGIVRWLGGERSPVTTYFQRWQEQGIEYLGVLGMVMRHAPTARAALESCFAYPHLIWGHSRLVVSQGANAQLYTFHMERPALRDATEEELDCLVQHCLAQDIVASARNIQDIVASGAPPTLISFTFAQPDDWHEVADALPCPVHFDSTSNCLVYPDTFDDTPLPGANPLLFASYKSIAERLSQSLTEDISLAERVSRWLWASSPPLKRAEIASLLALSERSLTRQLASEGTSYASLLAQVQRQRAENFLRSPQLTVAEIAYRLGYSEPAAFTRAFSTWTGHPPQKTRKRHREGLVQE